MSRLEEIKNEYAFTMQYPNWDEFISDLPIYSREEQYDKISELYAEECVKSSLDKASESAKLGYEKYLALQIVDKESITNESNIILL